jgi:predicted RNA-binding protein with PUA-like domain
MVDIQLEEAFSNVVPITALRDVPALKNMELLRKGSRLSVQPVTEAEFAAVLNVADTLGVRGKKL